MCTHQDPSGLTAVPLRATEGDRGAMHIHQDPPGVTTMPCATTGNSTRETAVPPAPTVHTPGETAVPPTPNGSDPRPCQPTASHQD